VQFELYRTPGSQERVHHGRQPGARGCVSPPPQCILPLQSALVTTAYGLSLCFLLCPVLGTGLGLANLVGACFQAYPTGGSFSRSAVSDDCGAKTGLAGIVSVLLVLFTLLFLTPLFAFLPLPVLGGEPFREEQGKSPPSPPIGTQYALLFASVFIHKLRPASILFHYHYILLFFSFHSFRPNSTL